METPLEALFTNHGSLPGWKKSINTRKKKKLRYSLQLKCLNWLFDPVKTLGSEGAEMMMSLCTQMAMWTWARRWEQQETKRAQLFALVRTETAEGRSAEDIQRTAGPWQTHRAWAASQLRMHALTHTQTHTCIGTSPPLTFPIGFEVSVHRRRLAVAGHRPARRRLGTGAEAHVCRRRHLLPQGGELDGAGGHGDVVGFVHWLRHAVVGRGVGAHWDVVLVHLFCRMAADRHHVFVFLQVTN